MSAELAFALPLALALAGAVSSLVADAFRRDALASWLAVMGAAAGAAVAFAAAVTVAPAQVWRVFLTGAGYSTVVGVVLALGALSVATALGKGSPTGASFGGLVALSAVGAAVLATATDLVAILVALETVALTSYALVAMSGTPRAHEAAMKYFVQGAIASALYVLGFAAVIIGGALLSADGSFTSASSGVDLPATTAGVTLLVAALAFKLGAFPFHAWAPDAYETAPPQAVVFLASGPKLAALVAMYTVAFEVLGGSGVAARATWLVALIAAASVVYGNLAALSQKNFARMLAYSGIAQVGYGLTALVIQSGTLALMFGAAYACAAAGAFAAVAAFKRIDSGWDVSISGLAGFGRRAPLLSASVAVLLFSLTGIPPLFGFWGKFLVFMATASDPAWLWLAILGVLGSVVSFGYYGRVLRALYFDDAPESESARLNEAGTPRVGSGAAGRVAVLLAVIVLVVGLVPLVWGFGSMVGLEPSGVFVIGTLLP